MYSPTLGRFLQTDPIGYADGLNWYAYVGNDPVNATDPSGLSANTKIPNASCPRGVAVAGACPDTPPEVVDAEVTVTGRRRGPVPAEPLRQWQFPRSDPSTPGTGEGMPQNDEEGEVVVTAAKKVGQCALDQFGITGLLDAGTAALGIPQEGSKPFVTPGSSKGTSALSEGLARRFPQRIGNTSVGRTLGIKRIWTPRLGQLNRATPVIGRAAGRLIPVVGAILFAKDVVQIGICAASD